MPDNDNSRDPNFWISALLMAIVIVAAAVASKYLNLL